MALVMTRVPSCLIACLLAAAAGCGHGSTPADAQTHAKAPPKAEAVVPPTKVDEKPVVKAEEKPTVVAAWEHQVIGRDSKPAKITLYSNGKINDPDSVNTWSRKGNTLSLYWPNPQAPGGKWVDSCTLSTDGATFSGRNQIGTRVTGKLVMETAAWKPKAPPHAASSPATEPGGSEKVQLLLQKAVKGDAVAMRTLAYCYLHGDGVAANETKSHDWMIKAAHAGDGEAMYRVSLNYRRGQGVPRDTAKANEWLQNSAQMRFDPRTLGTPGQTAENNPNPGSKPPLVNIEQVKSRANAGNTQSMYELGVYLCTGSVLPKDEKKGIEWLEKAAKGGHVEAMNDLGCCYYYGKCVKQDAERAKEWLTKAAQAGSPQAQKAFAKAGGSTSWDKLSVEQKRKISVGVLLLAWSTLPQQSEESRQKEQEEMRSWQQYFRDRENQERYQQGLPPK